MDGIGINWENLSSNVVLGMAFLFIVRWMLGRFNEDSRAFQQAIEVNTITLLAMQQQLLAHDLTTSGIRESSTEDAQVALRKYEDVARNIAEVKHMILRHASIRKDSDGITEKINKVIGSS